MDAATQSCCRAAPRLPVSELFARGFRRNRAAPLTIEGARCADGEGLSACFSLDVASGQLVAIGFRASTCVTLLAYCELVAETMIGSPPRTAQQLSPADLVGKLPGVPRLKQNRALLAIAAFRAALAETAHCTDHDEDALP